MALNARQVTATTGQLNYGPSSLFSNRTRVAGSVWINVESCTLTDLTTGRKGILGQWGTATADQTFFLSYSHPDVTGLSNRSIELNVTNQAGSTKLYQTTVDLFNAGSDVPVTGWHLLVFWFDKDYSPPGGILWDGSSASISLSGTSIGSFGSSGTGNLVCGSISGVGDALTGMALCDLGFYETWASGAFLTDLMAGVGSAFVNPAYMIDAAIISGSTPEHGVTLSGGNPVTTTANGSITDASTVTGPTIIEGLFTVSLPSADVAVDITSPTVPTGGGTGTARQFTDTDGQLDYGPSDLLHGGVNHFGGSVWLNVESCTLSSVGTSRIPIVSQWSSTGSDQTFFVSYSSPTVTGLSSNCIEVQVHGSTTRSFQSTSDPFDAGGGTPVTGWHLLSWYWDLGATPTQQIAWDGTPLSLSLGGVTPAYLTESLASLLVGANADLGNAMVGMGCGDLSIYSHLDGTDLAVLAAGGASTTVNSGHILDANLIFGNSPEHGIRISGPNYVTTTANGSITHADVIAGPVLGPGQFVAISLSQTNLHHNSTTVATFTWANDYPPSASVTLTPTCSAGTFSPATVVLGTSPTDSITSTLTVGSSVAYTTYTITVANDGGLSESTADVLVSSATVQIRSAIVAPSGNLLAITMERISDHADVAVTGVVAGGTLTVNSTVIPLTDPLIRTGDNYIAYPLNSIYSATVDEVDAECSLTGATWTTGNNPADAAVFIGDHYKYSNDLAALATYTFANVPPGRYRIWLIYAAGSDRTTDAQYLVKDGTTTIGTFHVDQTAHDLDLIYGPPFHGVDSSHRYSFMDKLVAPSSGFVTITTGTSVTIAVSNNGAGGYLTVDAIRLERLISPPDGVPAVSPGDTLTLEFPVDSIVTTGGETTDAISMTPTGAAADDAGKAAWFGFDPNADRTMVVGFNMSTSDPYSPVNFHGNRFKKSFVWNIQAGSATFDSGNNPTSVSTTTPGAMACSIGLSGTANGDDTWGPNNSPASGTWTFKYTSAGNPTCSIQASSAFYNTDGPVACPDEGSKKVFTQVITEKGTVGAYCGAIAFGFSGQGAANDFPSDIEVYGPECGPPYPAAPTTLTSPVAASRISGSGRRSSCLRHVDSQGIDTGPNNCLFSDINATSKHSFNIPTRTISFSVVSVDPVDLTDADTDSALSWFSARPNEPVVKVTTASPHGLKNGMVPTFNFTSGGPPWVTNQTGGTFHCNTFDGLVVVLECTSTTFLAWMIGEGTPSNNPNPGKPITIAASHTPTGTVDASFGTVIPVDDIIDQANELAVSSIRFHIPTVMAINSEFDDEIAAWATRVIDRLNPGIKVEFTVTNEVWNFGSIAFSQTYIFQFLAHHEGYGSPREAYGHACNHVFGVLSPIFATAGRSSDLVRLVESFIWGPGLTTLAIQQINSEGGDFDALAIAFYIDNIPDAYNSLAAYGRLDIASQVDLYALNIWHSGQDGAVASHRAALDDASYSGRFSGVKINGYEGALQNAHYNSGGGVSPPFSHAVVSHPNAYWLTLGYFQFLQNAGVERLHYYTLDSYNGSPGAANWRMYRSDEMGVGTGSITENPNLWDVRRGVSQLGGAQQSWMTIGEIAQSASLPTASVSVSSRDLGANMAVPQSVALPTVGISASPRDLTLTHTQLSTQDPTTLAKFQSNTTPVPRVPRTRFPIRLNVPKPAKPSRRFGKQTPGKL